MPTLICAFPASSHLVLPTMLWGTFATSILEMGTLKPERLANRLEMSQLGASVRNVSLGSLTLKPVLEPTFSTASHNTHKSRSFKRYNFC